MTDKTIDLDQHRGMLAQKATDLRRLLADVQGPMKGLLRLRQDELESHLIAAPAASWQEAAKKARYLLNLYAAALTSLDPRRQKLIAAALGLLVCAVTQVICFDGNAAARALSRRLGSRLHVMPPCSPTNASAIGNLIASQSDISRPMKKRPIMTRRSRYPAYAADRVLGDGYFLDNVRVESRLPNASPTTSLLLT
jgi:hypothetical protein